jgi:CCR4-NOT transcription complex subunit 1
VTVTLLRSGLVNITLQDQQLAKLLFEDARPILMNFTANLIRQCLSTDPPVATQGQFVFSLEMLNQLEQAGKATEEYVIHYFLTYHSLITVIEQSQSPA